ncbi:MAG: phage baseplate assembly protein V [bacterium]|nr:phage baseplate assembly protein V [bacterium]
MRISGFENIVHLTQFALDKSCGAHSVLRFAASIRAEDAEAFLGRAGQEIQVLWDGEEKPKCIFSGKAEEVRILKQMHLHSVEVRALSLSAAECAEEHTRIWQSPSKKLGEVLSASKLALAANDLRLAPALAAQPYAEPILQNQESNFAFLLRMSAYMGIPLWIDDTKKGKGAIALAEALSETAREIAAEDILRYVADREKSGRQSFTLTLPKYLPFGSKVKIAGESGEYVICALHVELRREIYEFSYQLQPYAPWKYQAAPWPRLEKAVCLKGIVENNRDEQNLGRLQISFKEAGIQEMDAERMWMPYHSPYTGLAGGMVFLPDNGDKVNAVFSNEGLYASAALRENVLAEECRKIEDKYLGNNTLQRIFFRDKSLMIASGDYSMLMDEEKIKLTVGESTVTMSKEAITLKQGPTELLLDNKGIYLKAGGSEMACSDQGITGRAKQNIGWDAPGGIDLAGKGRINIEAKGALSLNGSIVNIG